GGDDGPESGGGQVRNGSLPALALVGRQRQCLVVPRIRAARVQDGQTASWISAKLRARNKLVRMVVVVVVLCREPVPGWGRLFCFRASNRWGAHAAPPNGRMAASISLRSTRTRRAPQRYPVSRPSAIIWRIV